MEKSPEARAIGHLGWFALSAFVIGWDWKAEETLSRAFARGLDNDRARPWVVGAWAVTTAHLFRALPETIDPFLIPTRIARHYAERASAASPDSGE